MRQMKTGENVYFCYVMFLDIALYPFGTQSVYFYLYTTAAAR